MPVCPLSDDKPRVMLAAHVALQTPMVRESLEQRNDAGPVIRTFQQEASTWL